MNSNSAIIKRLVQTVESLDCGSSSCAFVKKRGGMRTNGGCTCLEKRVPGLTYILGYLAKNSDQVIKELEEMERVTAETLLVNDGINNV